MPLQAVGPTMPVGLTNIGLPANINMNMKLEGDFEVLAGQARSRHGRAGFPGADCSRISLCTATSILIHGIGLACLQVLNYIIERLAASWGLQRI